MAVIASDVFARVANRLPFRSTGAGASYREGQGMTAEDDLKPIHQIIAGGGGKYTAGNIDHRRYDRLVNLGWLMATRAIRLVEFGQKPKPKG